MIDPETLVSLIALSVTGDITPDELAKESSTAPEHVARALKNNRDAVKLFIEQQMEAATEYLKDYMKVFAGEQEANKISVNDVVFTYVPGKFSNPYKNPSYKQHNYQIPAETDETVRKIKLKQLSKNPKAKQYDLQNVCFKIGYSLSGAK